MQFSNHNECRNVKLTKYKKIKLRDYQATLLFWIHSDENCIHSDPKNIEDSINERRT